MRVVKREVSALHHHPKLTVELESGELVQLIGGLNRAAADLERFAKTSRDKGVRPIHEEDAKNLRTFATKLNAEYEIIWGNEPVPPFDEVEQREKALAFLDRMSDSFPNHVVDLDKIRALAEKPDAKEKMLTLYHSDGSTLVIRTFIRLTFDHVGWVL